MDVAQPSTHMICYCAKSCLCRFAVISRDSFFFSAFTFYTFISLDNNQKSAFDSVILVIQDLRSCSLSV